jgi:hypothetical protein
MSILLLHEPPRTGPDSVRPLPQARMGRMFLTTGRMRRAESGPVRPCCRTGEETAR